jgi:hypothetical protein
MERKITFRPAFDKRDSNPSKNYGVHGVDMLWYIKGELGVVDFVVYTNWHLPHIEELNDSRNDSQFPHLNCHPQPANVGYHSRVPKYKGQTRSVFDCTLLGGDCYSDGSGLYAEELYDILVREGDEAVWKKLEEYYKQTFGELR